MVMVIQRLCYSSHVGVHSGLVPGNRKNIQGDKYASK